MLTLFGRPRHGGDTTPYTTAPPTGAPSNLLVHLAGEFAPQIASVWAAPHTPFVLAEAARRHLACLALACAEIAEIRPGPAFVVRALDGSLKRAVADLIPDAPAGLVRALGRLGEAALAADDYRRLVDLLRQASCGKVLRHAPAITARAIAVLSSLPTCLAEHGGTLLKLTEPQGRAASLCYDGILRRDGIDHARAVARRWAAAPTVKALFDQMRSDIGLEYARPFHPGAGRLKPLATRKAMADAAHRFRNCLEGREPCPTSHYYEWEGPPGAVVQVVADPLWGWVLAEGRLAGNEPVPADVRAAITADLAQMGVYVGPTRWSLRWILESAHEESFTFDDDDKRSSDAFEG